MGLAGGGFSPLAFAVSSVVVWAIVMVGVAAGLLPRAEPPQAALAAGGCLLLLAGLIALSLAWALDDGTAYEDAVRASAYLGVFVLVVVASRRGEAAPWLRGLAAGLVVIALAALGSRFEPGLLGDDSIIAERLPNAANRLSYPIGYWNGLAALMAICAVVLAWLGARGETRVGRALAVGLIPLPVLAIYAATSRGGFFALALGLAAMIVAMRRRFTLLAALALGGGGSAVLLAFAATKDELFDRPGTALAASQGDQMLIIAIAVVCVVALARYAVDRPVESFQVPRALFAAAVGSAVGALIAAVLVFDVSEKWEQFKQPPGVEADAGIVERDLIRGSSSGRYQYWAAALDAFAEEPLRGIGSGGFEAYWNRNGTIPLTARETHSLFLESAAELGLGGAAASLGFFGVAGFAAVRRRGTLGGPGHGELAAAVGVLAAGAAAAAIDWTWNLPAVFAPVVLAVALLTGPATLPALAPKVEPPMAFMRSRRRFAAGIAVLLVAWAAICGSGLVVLAERALGDAEDALARGDLDAAVERATEAMDLQPWAAEPHRFLAVAHQRAGDIPSAQSQLAEAIERAPRQWRLWLYAVELDVAANDLAGARANLARVHALLPNFKRETSATFRSFLPGS